MHLIIIVVQYLHSMTWSGKFAKNNEQNKAVRQALDGVTKLTSTLEKLVSSGNNVSNKGSGKGGKSGGKGKGSKGSGKGAVASNPLIEGSWLCKRLNCAWAESGKANLPFRSKCGCCLHPKSEAMNPPAHSKVQPKGAPSISVKSKDNSAHAKSFAEVMKEGAQALIPVLESTKPLDMTIVSEVVKAKKAEDRRVGFDEPTTQGFIKIAPALTDVFNSLKQERRANPMNQGRDPEATAEKFISDSKPVAKSNDLAKAESETERLQSILMHLPETDPQHENFQNQLKEAQLLVTRLTKEVPSRDLRASCLEEITAPTKDLSAQERTGQTKDDRRRRKDKQRGGKP